MPRVRRLLATLAAAAMAFALHPARAQQDPSIPELPTLSAGTDTPEQARQAQPRTIGGEAPRGPCVIVEIAGTRAGHLDCATRALEEAARIAQSEARAGIDAPIPKAGSPDTQVGVAHQAATRLRMGSTFGNSVHSERPVSRPPRGGRQ